jgi:protein TonB
MQKARIDGKVIIEMIVDAKGVPQQVQVAQATHPLYVEPALNAVRQWRYRPALKNGQPVASQLTVPLEFRRDTSLDIIPEH